MSNASGDPTQLTLTELGAAYRARQLSPVDATRACLDRIARLDPELHAFITVTGELALDQARAAQAELARGRDRGPLHGVPIALKDLVDTAGVRTTGGSALFEDRVPSEDAEVVRRLRDAGAVMLGKLNLHEMAYGASGMIGHFPITRNPRNPAHICGGSSSGSGAAVAAGMCYAAIGSDTAGSIRIPAALCGIVGFMPSYGLVSLRGVIPLAWSYDHVGPMTRTVRDAALVLQAIAGYDPADITSIAFPGADYVAAVDGTAGTPPPRLGVARSHFFEDLDPEVAAAVERALGVLAGLGATLRDVEIAVDEDRTVARAETYAYHRPWLDKASERYQPETLRRIRTGEPVTGADYVDRWRDLQRMRRAAPALFADVDLIVMPTTVVPAPTIAELAARPDELRPRELVLMRNTRMFDVLGTAGISVPCGTTAAGLPIGLQIIGAPGADAAVLRLAAAYEAAAR
ncbi:MAG TPA: amidase [Kofleriaceae bacterium]|jgi:aspartyl-tRNA(Asn)/glutamyl-tRNA(Gln) amidotransferase subunit A|nr:amidase [Kofleriaceae bacterium]